jgi:hypothetical protein
MNALLLFLLPPPLTVTRHTSQTLSIKKHAAHHKRATMGADRVCSEGGGRFIHGGNRRFICYDLCVDVHCFVQASW